MGVLPLVLNGGAKTPQDIIDILKAGNSRFVEGISEHPHSSAERRKSVAGKQSPDAVVITCSDSRVVPEFIFDGGIGDLFVIRTAGNTIGPKELGSIEYAVEHLRCKLIVVLGHTNCGAVKAAFDHTHTLPGAMPSLVKPIFPAVNASSTFMGDRLTNAVTQNVRMVVGRLGTADKLMKETYHGGKVTIVGAVYNLETGKVDWLPKPAPARGLQARK